MSVREEFEAWAVINWMYVDRKEDALVIWLDAYAAGRRAEIEEAIQAVPGGSICDPQQVADYIRALNDDHS